MSNFELVQKYGASVFVIHKFLEENPNSCVTEIQDGTGLSDKCVKTCLKTLVDINLLNKFHVSFNKYGHGFRYSTIQLQ